MSDQAFQKLNQRFLLAAELVNIAHDKDKGDDDRQHIGEIALEFLRP